MRYTVVRLLDAPDELRGREIGALGEGDEVELLERQGAYWLVACPDGGRGWIHKMTLGATVGGQVADAPSATLPIAADSWTMGDRRRRGRAGRLSRLAAPPRLDGEPEVRAGSRRSTMMCWWAMFGTNARG